MHDLTELEKGQIVGARIVGASVTKTADVLGFSRAIISRTMTEFKKHGKTSSNRNNYGLTCKLIKRPTNIKTHCGKKTSDYCRKSDCWIESTSE